MANLTIRNLDDETVEVLKQRAKSHNRSLEAEARQILTDTARPGAGADLRSLAERIALLTPEVRPHGQRRTPAPGPPALSFPSETENRAW